jgi:AcrR family transcriptional regulator
MHKGETTRSAILSEAANLASIMGLNGLSIGALAAHTGMSKSGLFRHFGSKEDLQVATLKAGVDRFMEVVVRPALKARRGMARVRELFGRWLDWETEKGLEGGCLFIAASIELDDQPGAARDYLVATQGEWLGFLAEAARRAVEVGDFRPDLDVTQFAHEFNAIFLGFHQAHRLMKDPHAAQRAHRQFERLVQDATHAATPA